MNNTLICPFTNNQCYQEKCGIFDKENSKCSLCYLSELDELKNINTYIGSISGTLGAKQK